MKRTIFGKVILAAACAAFVAGAYTPGVSEAGSNAAPLKLEAAKQSYIASVRAEALRTNSEMPDLTSASNNPAQWLSRVKASNINMVTNKVSTESQKAIDINGKTYFVPNEAFAKNLANNPSLRFATDPLTNKKVNKSDAATYADAAGKVYYFESDTSLKSFLALGTQKNDTVFGYSEPR